MIFNAKLFSKVQFCQCSNIFFLSKMLLYATLRWGYIDHFPIVLEDIVGLLEIRTSCEFSQCSLQCCFLGRLCEGCSVLFVEIHLSGLTVWRNLVVEVEQCRAIVGLLRYDFYLLSWLFFCCGSSFQSSPCCHLRHCFYITVEIKDWYAGI